MAAKSCVGLFCHDAGFAAVLLEKEGDTLRQLEQRRFGLDGRDVEQGNASVLDQVAGWVTALAARRIELVLSLSGRYYQSQRHHTEFTDEQQIRQTLRFDIEDEISFASEEAILCYQRLPNPGHIDPGEGGRQHGTSMLVHVARRERLETLLNQLESVGLDPLIVQPDLASWQQFARHLATIDNTGTTVSSADQADRSRAWIAVNGNVLSIMILDRQGEMTFERSVLLPGSLQNRTTVAANAVSQSLASLAGVQEPAVLRYVTSQAEQSHPDDQATNGSDPDSEPSFAQAMKALAESRGMAFELEQGLCYESACAMGAAAGWLEGDYHADFRADGLPPASLQKERKQAILSFSAICSALLLLVVLIFTLHSHAYQRIHQDSLEQMTEGYRLVYPDRKLPRSEQLIPRIIRRMKSDLSSQSSDQAASLLPDSAGRTLMLLLNTLNQLPEEFDLYIESMRLTNKSALISGSVPSQKAFETLIGVVRQHGRSFELGDWEFSQSSTNRNAFSMSLSVRLQAATDRED